MGRVASFGSINVDRVANLDAATLAELRERYDWFPAPGETREVGHLPADLGAHVTETLPGGKGANQAVAAAGAGARSHLYGKVGTDRGENVVADRGVDVSAVGTADAPTGTAYVFVAPDGENHIAILGGANGTVDLAYARAQAGAIAEADVLLVQNEVPPEATTTLLDALAGRADRPTVMLDPAPAEGAAPLLEHACVDVVTPNETEADALAEVLSPFDGVVVRTQGPDPIVVETPGERFEVTPPPAAPVDTTGAGDVFAGYLGAGLADGVDLGGDVAPSAGLREAVEWACAAASLSVEESGVQRATPDRDAVRRRLTG